MTLAGRSMSPQRYLVPLELVRPIGAQVGHTLQRLLLGWGGTQAASRAHTRSVDKGTIKIFSSGPLYSRINLGSQAPAKGAKRVAQSFLLLGGGTCHHPP